MGKTKIAVLGGGVGALTAVYEITSQPGWDQKYEITVHQLGWRLGGKGASGRRASDHQRIEEHGLHIWFGFYENAFRVIRSVYDELGRGEGAPLRAWDDAFKPQDRIVLMDHDRTDWKRWILDFPRNDEVPGSGGELPTPWGYVRLLLGWMKEELESSSKFDVATKEPTLLERVVRAVEELPHIGAALEAFTRAGVLAEESTFLHVAHAIAEALPDDPRTHAPHQHDRLRWLLVRFVDHLEHALGREIEEDDASRRLFLMLDIAAATVRGILADGLLRTPNDFSAIDGEDFQAWLERHGARHVSVHSAPVTALYDLVFAVDKGFAAGTVVHGALRMLFSYKGAVMWKMQAGMGDTIFAPLYLVLKKRGVRFEFFHKVDAISSDGGGDVDRIELTKQVTLKKPEYEPLVDVKGLPCWPSDPDPAQIEETLGAHDLESFWGDWKGAGKITLEKGRDFDLVILGIPVGAHPHVARDLMDKSPAFRHSAETVKTTRTQAFQVWATATASELGWPGPSPVLGAYAEPFDTWADMSHLLVREVWDGTAVRNISYFCSPLLDRDDPPPAPDPSYPAKQKANAKANALGWIEEYLPRLWPGASQGGRFDWSLLFDASNRVGEARFDAQYWRANVNPTDRYVLSVPGTTSARLHADESGFRNLVLAGDWLRTGINAGCVEAAVMGGLQASRAICGKPERIVGDPSTPARGIAEPAISAPLTVTLPAYVERHGDLAVRHPYGQRNAKIWSFVVPADYASLEATCDRYLARPGMKTRYKPLGPIATLVAADIAEIHSLDPEDAKKGYIPERDLGLWIPVLAGHYDGPLFVPERFAFFIPYLFVDNGIAMSAGREVYGFPKQMGKLVYPGDPGANAEIHADTLVLPEYSPTTRVTEKRVIDAWREDDDAIDLRAIGSDAASVVRGLVGELIDLAEKGTIDVPSWELARDILRDVTHEEVAVVFLKQFRDVADPSRACYQAVVEAPARVRKIQTGGLMKGDWRVEVTSWESHPLASDLGLADGAIRSLLATYVEVDFDMELGRAIWSAPLRSGADLGRRRPSMPDLVVVVALVVAFALLVTFHLSVVIGLTRRAPRWHGPVALVAAPLAPYWALRSGMRVRGILWIVTGALYLVALVLALR